MAECYWGGGIGFGAVCLIVEIWWDVECSCISISYSNCMYKFYLNRLEIYLRCDSVASRRPPDPPLRSGIRSSFSEDRRWSLMPYGQLTQFRA